MNTRCGDPSKWRVIQTGRTDIKPNEEFTYFGYRWRALTYPHGAKREIRPGIFLELGPVYDPEDYIPEIGELTAELLGEAKVLDE